MTDILSAIVVALIGGAVVFITTGPALGSTRSRKAVRELLEIREALKPSDNENQRKITKLLDREIGVLSGLGDTRKRLVMTAVYAGGTAAAVGAVTGIGSVFIPLDSAREGVLYVSGAAFLMSAAVPIYGMSYAIDQCLTRGHKVRVALALPASSMLLIVAAAVVVRDTSYIGYLLDYWENPDRL